MKKEMQKNLSFVLFVMAVFFAGMSLTVFREYIWMACIAGVLLLATSVFFVLSREKDEETPAGKASDILMADRMAELMRGNEKAEKGVYIAVKKQHEAMESGLAALEEKLDELIKAQENSVKTLVMYNKENAKQMALSEREELGRLREEVKQLQPGEASGSSAAVVDAVRELSHRLYEEMHENSEAILTELGTTVDCLVEMKDILDGLTDGGTIRVVVPEAEEESKKITAAESQKAEEPVVVQEEPEEEVVIPEIPTPEEAPAEEKPEDALASSGVDLSDPNRTLSADDIAALIASLGN